MAGLISREISGQKKSLNLATIGEASSPALCREDRLESVLKSKAKLVHTSRPLQPCQSSVG
jgi:hypothetical protein